MLIFILSSLLIWNLVLTLHLLRDWRLLLRVLRWSTLLWLVLFGIFASEVLREGLIVHGDAALHWDVRLAWTAWFALVACSAFDWRLLVPAVALAFWFLGSREMRMLLNYGLVRLEWLGVVYNPLTWAAGKPGALDSAIRARIVVEQLLNRAIIPMRSFMEHAAAWTFWTTDRSLDRLRPPPNGAWFWFPLVRR